MARQICDLRRFWRTRSIRRANAPELRAIQEGDILPSPASLQSIREYSRVPSGFADDHTMSSTNSKSTLQLNSLIIVGEGVNRASTTRLHDGPLVLEQLEEEDSPSRSNTDLTDHTCKTSFDFTKELDRLNEGGSRMSFVAQLENTFKTPVRLSYHSKTCRRFWRLDFIACLCPRIR